MPGSMDAKAAAAFSICESLLLCLVDRKILNETDVIGLLGDAISAHRHEAMDQTDEEAAMHQQAAELIASMAIGGGRRLG